MHARRLFTALALSATLLVSSLPGIASAALPVKDNDGTRTSMRVRPAARPVSGNDSGIKASTGEYEPDDNINLATPLGSFTGADTLTGTLDPGYVVEDYDDVYAVYLYAGELLNVSMTGGASADFGLAFFGPAATDIYETLPLVNADPLYFQEPGSSNPTEFGWWAEQDGWYFINPYTWYYNDGAGTEADGGVGSYSIDVSIGWSTSRVRFNTPATPLAYGSLATVSGDVYDPRSESPLSGDYFCYYSFDNVNWLPYKSDTLSAGQFSFGGLDAYRNTYYLVTYEGDSTHDFSAKSTVIRSYASLSGVSASRKGTRKYLMYGTLGSAHAPGSGAVRIYLQRKVNGSWKNAGYQTATVANYNGVSRFSKLYTFPYKGTWRMRAYHSDSSHAATYGAWSASKSIY